MFTVLEFRVSAFEVSPQLAHSVVLFCCIGKTNTLSSLGKLGLIKIISTWIDLFCGHLKDVSLEILNYSVLSSPSHYRHEKLSSQSSLGHISLFWFRLDQSYHRNHEPYGDASNGSWRQKNTTSALINISFYFIEIFRPGSDLDMHFSELYL